MVYNGLQLLRVGDFTTEKVSSNLSILKTSKAKAIRFSTLDYICRVLECQPGDILEYLNEKEYRKLMG